MCQDGTESKSRRFLILSHVIIQGEKCLAPNYQYPASQASKDRTRRGVRVPINDVPYLKKRPRDQIGHSSRSIIKHRPIDDGRVPTEKTVRSKPKKVTV